MQEFGFWNAGGQTEYLEVRIGAAGTVVEDVLITGQPFR